MLRVGGAILARSVYSRSAGSTHGRSIGPSVHLYESKSVILDQTRCFFFGSGSSDDSDGDDKKEVQLETKSTNNKMNYYLRLELLLKLPKLKLCLVYSFSSFIDCKWSWLSSQY